MGSLVSPIVVNLYIEYFEQKALGTATHPPRLWLRHVDETFVIQNEDHKQNFLEYINSVDPAIKFTEEDKKEDGVIPFLYTTVKPEASKGLSMPVYKKPTHTDQYLQWDNHHHLSAKYSVINTLTHRAKSVHNKPELFQKGMDHLRKALTHCKYAKWAIDKVERRFLKLTSKGNNSTNTLDTSGAKPTTNEVNTRGHNVIPYTQGLCESIKKICNKYGIQTHFKGNSIINNLLVSPKAKDPMENKSGAIYWFQCGTLYVMRNT